MILIIIPSWIRTNFFSKNVDTNDVLEMTRKHTYQSRTSHRNIWSYSPRCIDVYYIMWVLAEHQRYKYKVMKPNISHITCMLGSGYNCESQCKNS